MTFDQALECSWERLELMAVAHVRRRARETLQLGQLIVAGWGDKNAWIKKQKELIKQTEIN